MFKEEKNIQAFEDETVLFPLYTHSHTHTQHTLTYTLIHLHTLTHTHIHTQTMGHCPSKLYGKMIFSLGVYVQAS